MMPKCVWFRRSSMPDMTARASAVDLAASTFGRSSSWMACQSRPLIFGIPVLVADGLPDLLEGVDVQLPLACLRGAGQRHEEDGKAARHA